MIQAFELDKKCPVVYKLGVQNVRLTLCTLDNHFSGGFTMAHIISDECIACGACIEECPVEAITEGDPIYKIDGGTCTDCGACVDVCPVSAISEG